MASKTDALALLKQDHDDVKALFKRFDATSTDKQRRPIATQICDALRLHAEVEEDIFYPAMRAAIAETDLVDEAEVEHQSVKYLISQIEDENLSSEMFRANVTVLKEYVEHHVTEEEQEMFPKAKAAKVDLAELGKAMMAAKADHG